MSGEPDAEGATARLRFAARSFRGKIVISTVAVMLVAMIAVGVGIQLLLGYTAQRDIDRVLDDRAASVITVIEQGSGQELVVPPDSLEPGVRVYDEQGQLVAGTIESEARDAADELATTDRVRTSRGPDDEVRLRGVPFSTPGGAEGVVVVSQPTTP